MKKLKEQRLDLYRLMGKLMSKQDGKSKIWVDFRQLETLLDKYFKKEKP